MLKAQPSLFIFNKDSHLEGIMHYNATLNDLSDYNSQLGLNDSALLNDEAEDLEEDEDFLDIDFEDEDDEDGFDFDLDEEEEDDLDEEEAD